MKVKVVILCKIKVMIFPGEFELKVGFDGIRALVKEFCLGPGRHCVDEMGFLDELPEIRSLLGQTEELRRILVSEENFPSQDYYDLTAELARIRTRRYVYRA